MSDQHSHSSAGRDYADKDIRVRPLLVFLMICLGFMGLTIFGTYYFFGGIKKHVESGDQLDNIHAQERQLPERAVLQGLKAAAADLRALREEEDALLHHYSWADREGGVVRIPIDQAIQIAVKQGYPVRQEASAP